MSKEVFIIDTETGEGMSDAINYFKRKLIESSKIPYKYFKSYSRRERKRKIKNLFE